MNQTCILFSSEFYAFPKFDSWKFSPEYFSAYILTYFSICINFYYSILYWNVVSLISINKCFQEFPTRQSPLYLFNEPPELLAHKRSLHILLNASRVSCPLSGFGNVYYICINNTKYKYEPSSVEERCCERVDSSVS